MTVSSNPVGTLLLVSQNVCLVLQRQTNVVKTRHQTVSLKIIYGKGGEEILRVTDKSLLKIDCEFVTFDLARPLKNRGYLVLLQNHRQQTILETVVGKDVGE